MNSAKDCQVSICLRKFNLEQIENLFKSYLGMLPELEEDNQKLVLDTCAALGEARAVSAEIENLKIQNGRLTAKRERLRQECNEAMKLMEKLDEHRAQLLQLIQLEKDGSESDMSQYVSKLQDVINKFRQSGNVYDEEMIKDKTENAKKTQSDLSAQEKALEVEITKLRNTQESLKADVPENILEIMGKTELEEKLKFLNCQCEKLRKLKKHD